MNIRNIIGATAIVLTGADVHAWQNPINNPYTNPINNGVQAGQYQYQPQHRRTAPLTYTHEQSYGGVGYTDFSNGVQCTTDTYGSTSYTSCR